jgi:hypothetical protein
MTTYFLFGAIATQVYFDYGMESVIRQLDSLECTVCKHTANDSALDLLEAYDGWGGYAIINEDEYEMLKEKINLHNFK